MTTNEYLQGVLKSQELSENSEEWKTLIARRNEVESVLRSGFPKSSVTIRYGGSRAKGTLIAESYDLDIVSYFANDDTCAGETLKEIYDNTAAVLGKKYSVVQKKTALRIRGQHDVDFHIDVVPGRFTDQTKTDCFLYQHAGEKDRLKTNLDVHIAYVRDSGVLDAARLLKLWKVRKSLQVCQFPFELLVIDVLCNYKKKPLEDQLLHVWTTLRDTSTPIAVKDPANGANDLTPMLAGQIWTELSSVSRATLDMLRTSGWEAVFGKLNPVTSSAAPLRAAAAAVAYPTKPWSR
jgi:hypothetical protein